MASVIPTYRFFSTEIVDDAVVVRPVDVYLQGTTLAEMIKLELIHILDHSACRLLILDLQNVKLISSSVISSLLGVKRHAAATNTAFRLCGMTESLRYVFRSLNMDGTVFSIVDDIESALKGDGKAASYFDVCGRLSPPDDEAP